MTCSCTPDSMIPDWAITVHPHELAFYQHHIEELQTIQRGISGVTQILQQMFRMQEAGDPPSWVNGHTQEGLFEALNALSSHAAHPIEFLLERALKYQPDDREKERINEKASPNRMAAAAEVSGTPRND